MDTGYICACVLAMTWVCDMLRVWHSVMITRLCVGWVLSMHGRQQVAGIKANVVRDIVFFMTFLLLNH